MLKADPVSVTELTDTAIVPEDVSVIDCVAGSFKATLPNETEVALIVRTALAAFN